MPELPDIDAYVAALQTKLIDARVVALRLGNPFILRSVEPAPATLIQQRVETIRRVGKRIAIGLHNDHWLLLHLMIAGRLQWHDTPPSIGAKHRIASIDFDKGSLLLTEAGTKKRASLYLLQSEAALQSHDPGGIEPLACTAAEFARAMQQHNHTLKRALTNPHVLSGIGNAYSDEILHVARMSPFTLTQSLSSAELKHLFASVKKTLRHWRQTLLEEAAGGMPAKVTAFRAEMRVHGKFGKPCIDCGQPVQRIRYKNNETNYCAACQTDGKIYKDRSLSRLLKDSWPTSLDDKL